jgi:hypothetical protein
MATLTIRGLGLLSALLITLGGCTSSGKSPEQPELSLVPTATTPDDQRTDRSKPGAAALVTVGPTQTVFDWSKDRCDNEDIPDLPARAFRDANGDVQLLATHYINRRFVGPSLDAIRRSCQVVMRSKMNADPSRYADHEWLASPYTTDGQTVYALIHDEYHGAEHTGRCPQRVLPCWYNSVTPAAVRRVCQGW